MHSSAVKNTSQAKQYRHNQLALKVRASSRKRRFSVGTFQSNCERKTFITEQNDYLEGEGLVAEAQVLGGHKAGQEDVDALAHREGQRDDTCKRSRMYVCLIAQLCGDLRRC